MRVRACEHSHHARARTLTSACEASVLSANPASSRSTRALSRGLAWGVVLLAAATQLRAALGLLLLLPTRAGREAEGSGCWCRPSMLAEACVQPKRSFNQSPKDNCRACRGLKRRGGEASVEGVEARAVPRATGPCASLNSLYHSRRTTSAEGEVEQEVGCLCVCTCTHAAGLCACVCAHARVHAHSTRSHTHACGHVRSHSCPPLPTRAGEA